MNGTPWTLVKAQIICFERAGKLAVLRRFLHDLQRIRHKRFPEPVGVEEVAFGAEYEALLEKAGGARGPSDESGQPRREDAGHSDPTSRQVGHQIRLGQVDTDLLELLVRYKSFNKGAAS